jgi:ubiquinone/menaquinone biosynthesis C-methylase UbiE
MDWEKLHKSSWKARPPIIQVYEYVYKEIKRGDKVCELGFGHPDSLRKILDLVGDRGKVVGVELSNHAIVKAREELKDFKNLELVQQDISLPLVIDNQFDKIICLDVLSMFGKNKIKKIIRNFFTLLKEDGIFYLTLPLQLCEPSSPKEGLEIYSIFNQNEIEDFIKDSAGEPVRVHVKEFEEDELTHLKSVKEDLFFHFYGKRPNEKEPKNFESNATWKKLKAALLSNSKIREILPKEKNALVSVTKIT